MQTKVLTHDVFSEIEKQSFRSTEEELKEAASQLSRVFGTDLKLHTINEDYALYSFDTDNYLKATYKMTDSKTIKLENFEHVAIDESSKNESRRQIIRNMIDALADDDTGKADTSWETLKTNFSFLEMVKKKAAKSGEDNLGDGIPVNAKNADEEDQAGKGKARSAGKAKAVKGDEEMKGKPPYTGELMTLKAVDSSLEENIELLPNFQTVLGKVENAAKKVAKDVLKEAIDQLKIEVKKDDKGEEEVDSVEIPNVDKKSKIAKVKCDAKNSKAKCHEARIRFAQNENNQKFVQKIMDVKHYNNMEDAEQLSESLVDIVTSNPAIIYVSKNELKEMVSRIFQNQETDGWDEDLCEDIAFGLRKLAYNTYLDRAYDVVKFAAVDNVIGLSEEVPDDNYEAFEEVSTKYFDNIYAEASKSSAALLGFSAILKSAADTLEADVQSSGLNESVGEKTVVELRQYSAQMKACAIRRLDENIVRMVVGSLLSKVANDYSLNDKTKLVPYGHFRPEIDSDKEYRKHTGKGDKDSEIGDEEFKKAGNPMAPKAKSSDDLDLDKTAPSKGFDVMKHGIHTNPMAPKAKNASDLDLS